MIYILFKKYLYILLKLKMECGTLPVLVRKNKRTISANWIKTRNATANDDEKSHPDWTEELETELQLMNNEDITF